MTALELLPLVMPVVALLVAKPMARAWRRVAERAPRVDGDRLVVTHARVYRVLFGVVACVVVVVATCIVCMAASCPEEVPQFVCFVMLVVGVGLLCLAVTIFASQRVRLEFDRRGLRGRTSWRGYREIPWHEISAIRYSTRTKYLTVVGAGGAAIVACAVMPGFHLLLAQLRERVGAGICDPAVAKAEHDPLHG